MNKPNFELGPFDKQHCYCTYLRKVFEANYLKGKYNKRYAPPLMHSIVLCILLWVLKSGIKSCFDGVVFQDAVGGECFSIRLRCYHLYYCFYEGFIPKIILVSGFFTFICVSYPLKAFRLDTVILLDLCAARLLKTLSRLPKSIERQQKYCWILLLYWIKLCLVFILSKSIFFELPVFIPLVF